MTQRNHIFIWLLLAAGLSGCLNLPATPEERRTGIDLVGQADSDSPIRVGGATRSEVKRFLGAPEQISADGRAIAYSYDPIVARRGFVFIGGPCGLCGYYPWIDRAHETLWLAFDADDKLQRFVSSRDGSASDWSRFCASASAPP